ncbi:MAG: two-component regulator propeller domain-containing protein [Phaeospirillum sp.]|nr:two-component regulator propeller domain-containing protein [Phaeospirillum sp.]
MRLIVLLIVALWLGAGEGLAANGAAPRIAEPKAWDMVVPPVFSHLTPADGLPYPVALGLAQDRHGFIWAATPGGLARWDGYRMTVFRHDGGDPNSLPENIVTSVLADKHGQVWLSTASGVILRYDETIRGFVTYRDRGGSFGRPHGMTGDDKGGIWVAGRQGLARLDAASKTWRYESALPAGEVGSVLIDRSGRVWAGTVSGLMWRHANRQSFEPVAMPVETSGDVVSALFEDGEGTIWFGTRRGLVGRVERDGPATLEPALPSSGHRVTAIAQPRPGVLWFGDYGGGIRELRQSERAVRRFTHDPMIGASLGDNSVTGLMIDRSGLVWVSSLRGVHRHILSNQRIMTVVRRGQGGLPGPDVRGVAATEDGKAWLGFRAEGVALLDPMANVIRTVSPGTGPGDLPGGVVQAIADTADGQLWVGQDGGLFRVDVASGKTAPYPPLAGANVFALYRDGTDLWAGSSMGLARIGLNGEPPRFFHFDRENPASLSDNSVQAVFRDRARRLWVSTQRGLNLLDDAGTGGFRRFQSDPDDPESLPSDIVSGIAEDRFGRIWLATASGVAVFDPARDGKPRFIRLGRGHGLPSDTVLSVMEGVDGKIIAATGSGLSMIDPQTLDIRSFGPAEGLHIQTFWAGSAARMSDGTILLGGFGGMAVVRPTLPPIWDFHPPVVVTELRVGGRTVPASDAIVISPEDGGFQVDFAALDFSAPDRNRYAYRLVGNDGDWTVTDAHRRTAGYTNLSPGSYRLELRASNSVGVWAEPPRVLAVRVLPAWHQTLWFRLLAGLAVLLAMVAAAQVRKAYYLRREQELTRQVAAKTSEAEAAKMRALTGEEDARQAKEEAEASARMKSRFLAIIGHEIRTPLNGLLGMLQLLDPRTLDHGPRELLSTAKTAGETLRHLVESVLEYGRDGAEFGKTQAAFDDVDLRRLAVEAVELMRSQALAKGLTLTLEVEPSGSIWIRCDHTKLSRILINLLGNAIKFTERGMVAVDLSAVSEDDGTRLTIKVTDTGIGIAPEIRYAIFGDFVQADDSITRKYGGAGLGLAVSRRMAAQMGGTLTVESAIGVGSSFRLDVTVAVGTEIPASEACAFVPTGPGLRVLVVDDDEINRQVARRLLLRLGHCPTMVESGGEAIGALSSFDVDVVLMDLRMPGMDGMETARRIRRLESGRENRLRIFAMTADLTDDVLRQCVAAGMDSGLPKPIQLGRLRDVLAGVDLPDLPLFPREGLLDVDFLRAQMDILGSAEMIRLARLFQRTSRLMVGAMEAAAETGDRATIEAQAHRLRSAAGALCLSDLVDKAARIEGEAPLASQVHLQAQIVLLREARRMGLRALGVWARGIAFRSQDVDGDPEPVANAADGDDRGVSLGQLPAQAGNQ